MFRNEVRQNETKMVANEDQCTAEVKQILRIWKNDLIKQFHEIIFSLKRHTLVHIFLFMKKLKQR